MSHLNYGDACPYCWHNPVLNQKNYGIGTFSLWGIIAWSGGVLDKYKTCNQCKWNFSSIKKCVSCLPKTACPKHYAVLYNGSLNHNIPLEFHRLYMYNSPYKKKWSNRPYSIGQWYAKQVKSHMEVVHMIRRFTDNYEIQIYLNSFENALNSSVNNRSVFWNNLICICRKFFSGKDALSMTMRGFYLECYQKF